VIHINTLKEGWDVSNLFTIVPLRASASDILTEQTLGRGLRLSYAKRTGVEAVDRLTVIAQDRFNALIEMAKSADGLGSVRPPNRRPRPRRRAALQNLRRRASPSTRPKRSRSRRPPLTSCCRASKRGRLYLAT